MVECGLIRKRKEGDGYYDFYRDRIMISIRDRFRNIIGWTARDMSEVDGTPNTSILVKAIYMTSQTAYLVLTTPSGRPPKKKNFIVWKVPPM